MAYGLLYKFYFQSRNRAAIEINISRRGYTGEVFTRPLGRAPLLRRDNNAGIYGTSLELYAECTVPGEYAQLYTSSAYEYMINLYRNGRNIWTGFLTPELYSEPDRPAPYDVRIVATDGLGELKRSNFESLGTKTLREHLDHLLADTGISRQIVEVSSLTYDTGTSMAMPSALLDHVSIDLSHEEGNTHYDVLQHLLSSLNAGLTVNDNDWLLFRETDFIRKASDSGLTASRLGNTTVLPIVSFGSAQTNTWWPVGNMSVIVEPARHSIEIKSPYHYMDNMLKSWTLGNAASYSENESAYVLPALNDYISQTLNFANEPVQYRLALKIKARNVGDGEDPQNLSIKVSIDGVGYSGSANYWLVMATGGRGDGKPAWSKNSGSIVKELSAPILSETAEDAESVDIVIPLYYADPRGYMRANSLTVEITNAGGIYPVYVHEVTLVKYEQADGQLAEVIIDNGAREEASSVDLQMTDGTSIPVGGRWSMTGLPFHSNGQVITRWSIVGNETPADYLAVMAQDYAQKVGGARLRYTGSLNVPAGEQLPCLFMRDNTFYWPRTYSYDLYNDEMEVDLISVPDINVGVQIK